MSKKMLGTGVKPSLEKYNMTPIYDKGGVLIYEIETDFYMLTNEDNQFNYMGNKEFICERCPDWCA